MVFRPPASETCKAASGSPDSVRTNAGRQIRGGGVVVLRRDIGKRLAGGVGEHVDALGRQRAIELRQSVFLASRASIAVDDREG